MVNTPCSVLSARYVSGVSAGAGPGLDVDVGAGPGDEDGCLVVVVVLLVARGILSVLLFKR